MVAPPYRPFFTLGASSFSPSLHASPHLQRAPPRGLHLSFPTCQWLVVATLAVPFPATRHPSQFSFVSYLRVQYSFSCAIPLYPFHPARASSSSFLTHNMGCACLGRIFPPSTTFLPSAAAVFHSFPLIGARTFVFLLRLRR